MPITITSRPSPPRSGRPRNLKRLKAGPRLRGPPAIPREGDGNECGTLHTLPGRVPFLARIARPRLGAWVPWCRAGWPCSWCAARRGGCGIIRVDRAPRADPVPPGGPDPPGRPFPPGYLPAPGREGHQGRRGEQEPGGQGFRGRGRGGRFAGRGRTEATRPPWGSWGSAVPGGPDLPRLPDRRPSTGPVRRTPRMAAPCRPCPRRGVTP
jgi:hypothetical protein